MAFESIQQNQNGSSRMMGTFSAGRAARHAPYAVKLIAISFTVLFLALWIELAVNANVDGAAGNHMLHMDERITFGGIEQIQNASSFDEYIQGLTGPDQRYGRTTWYLAYIATLAGEPLGGDQGQIISTRMFFAVTLLIGIGLICWSVTQSVTAAGIAFVCVIFTPYVSYYATMPKPEPLLFLFLGLFMACAFRWQKPTGASFIFLGLAYGTKISALPAIALLGGYVLLRAALEDGTAVLKKALMSFAAFLGGFVLAVPILLIEFPHGMANHLRQTWGARLHGDDDENTGVWDWLQYIDSHAYFGNDISPFLIILPMAIVGTIPFLLVFLKTGDRNLFEKIRRALSTREAQIALVAGIGIAFLAAIMISVQRLWGFYLLPGALFLTIAAVAGAEALLRSHQTNLAAKLATLLALLFATSTILSSGYVYSSNHFRSLAARSEKQFFVQQGFRYETVLSFSEHLSNKFGRPVDVNVSARLWVPKSHDNATFQETFGPYRHWPANPDIVFLHPTDLEEKVFILRGTPVDISRKKSLKMLAEHSTFDGPCTDDLCYAYVPLPNDGMHFFIKMEWEEIAKSWIESGSFATISSRYGMKEMQ